MLMDFYLNIWKPSSALASPGSLLKTYDASNSAAASPHTSPRQSQELHFSLYLAATKIKLPMYSQCLLDCSTGRVDPDCHAHLARRSQISRCPNSIAAVRVTLSEGRWMIKRNCKTEGELWDTFSIKHKLVQQEPSLSFAPWLVNCIRLKLTFHQWDEMPPISQMKQLFWWRHSLDLFKFCLVLLKKEKLPC